MGKEQSGERLNGPDNKTEKPLKGKEEWKRGNFHWNVVNENRGKALRRLIIRMKAIKAIKAVAIGNGKDKGTMNTTKDQ